MFKKIQNKTKVGALLFMTLALAGAYKVIPFSSFEAADAAGAASVSLSPTTQSLKVNDTFTVTVAVNPAGDAIIGAQIKLSYDASKLQYVSHTENTSPLDSSLQSSVTTGALDITRVSFGSTPSTTFTFLQVTFKAVASGSPTVKILTGTETTRASDGSNSWNAVQTTATYTVTNQTQSPTPTPSPSPTPSPTPTPSSSPSSPKPTPTPSPNPAPTPTPSPSPAPSPASNPTSPADPTPEPPQGLILSQPSVVANSFKKLIVEMKTARPVKAKLLYGLDGTLASASTETEPTTSPSVEIRSSMLVPGRTYSYAMALTEADGSISQSSTQTFVSKGYRLKVKLLYQDGRPYKQKKVRLNSEPREGTTDDNGEVIFEDVEVGDHTVSFDVAGTSVSQPVTVAANETVADGGSGFDLPLQAVEFQVSQDSGSKKIPMMIGGTIGIVVVVGAAAYVLKQKMMQLRPYVNSHVTLSGTIQQQNDLNGNSTQTDDFLRPNPPAVSSVIHPDEQLQNTVPDLQKPDKRD